MIVFNYFFCLTVAASYGPCGGGEWARGRGQLRVNRVESIASEPERLLSVYACFINFHHTSSAVSVRLPQGKRLAEENSQKTWPAGGGGAERKNFNA